MKYVLVSVILAASFSAFAFPDVQCEKSAPSNLAKVSGSKASEMFESMDTASAQSGQDSLGRIWFVQKSKSVELSECTVGDCTYIRSRVSRCVRAFNGRVDCSTQDESSSYCIDNR